MREKKIRKRKKTNINACKPRHLPNHSLYPEIQCLRGQWLQMRKEMKINKCGTNPHRGNAGLRFEPSLQNVPVTYHGGKVSARDSGEKVTRWALMANQSKQGTSQHWHWWGVQRDIANGTSWIEWIQIGSLQTNHCWEGMWKRKKIAHISLWEAKIKGTKIRSTHET